MNSFFRTLLVFIHVFSTRGLVEAGVNLVPDVNVLADSLVISYQDFSNNPRAHCLVADGCIGSAEGTRTLLRFTTKISNIGDENFRIGPRPTENIDRMPWHWDQCKNQWVVLGYASYELTPKHGDGDEVQWPCRWENGRLMPAEKRGRAPVASGSKNGFCLMDLDDVVTGSNTCTGGANCGNQGISVGCADVYSSGLQCQWIDITGIPLDNRPYELAVTVNPDQTMVEDDYSDNTMKVEVRLRELIADNIAPDDM